MIHSEAVRPEMLSLLSSFMAWPELSEFSLVGGTSLALRFGYRESDDIDLFTDKDYDSVIMREKITRRFPECAITDISKGSITAFFDGIKIDILRRAYKKLAPIETIDGIRFESLRDISAMKINAVSGRGSKKDFSDLLFLHDHGISLTESILNFVAKYGSDSRFAVLKSLTYFEDANDEPDPLYRNGWTWEEVMSRMEKLGRTIQRE